MEVPAKGLPVAGALPESGSIQVSMIPTGWLCVIQLI